MRFMVLIADDEQLERDAIELLITNSALPLDCIKARNGREAVELAQTHTLDIAFLDIRMPGITGIEAARTIKDLHPNCRIVFLTAWNSFDFAQEALRLGAKDFLVKPTVNRDVLRLLARFVEELENSSEKELQNVLNLFSRSFFSALRYAMVSEEAMRSYFTLHGISTEQGLAVVLEGLEESALRQTLEQSILRKPLQACYFPSEDRISVLIFSSHPETLAKELEKNTKEHFAPSTSHIGLSRPFKTLRDIPQALREASQAFNHAVALRTHLVRYNALEIAGASQNQKKTEEIEQQLVEAICGGSLVGAIHLARELLDSIALQTESTTERQLTQTYEMVLVVTRTVRSRVGNLPYEQPDKTNLMEMEQYLLDFISSTCALIQEDRQDKHVRLFATMRDYVENHYAEQLTLDHMATIAGLSPGYFSRLFKQYNKVSFVEYLNTVRIRIACQLIGAGMKIQETAMTVGFTDYSYFSKVFRHIEGLSPREFQQKLM